MRTDAASRLTRARRLQNAPSQDAHPPPSNQSGTHEAQRQRWTSAGRRPVLGARATGEHSGAVFLLDKVSLSGTIGSDVLYSQVGYAHDFVRVKRYGRRYKLIYFKTPVRVDGGFAERDKIPGDKIPDGKRLDNNISRARARVYELAACNDWDWFFTGTLDQQKYDRYNLPKWQKDFSQWLRNQRRLKGWNIAYLLIPERHKNGAWHMHGLFAGIPADGLRLFDITENIPARLKKQLEGGKKLYDWTAYRQKFGWVTLAEIEDPDRCASYISKYITKTLGGASMDCGSHLYYASRGLAGADLVAEGYITEGVVWDWEGEYCKIKWFDDGARLPEVK